MVFVYNEIDSALCSIFKEKYLFVILNVLLYQPNSEFIKYIIKPLVVGASVPTQTTIYYTPEVSYLRSIVKHTFIL